MDRAVEIVRREQSQLLPDRLALDFWQGHPHNGCASRRPVGRPTILGCSGPKITVDLGNLSDWAIVTL